MRIGKVSRHQHWSEPVNGYYLLTVTTQPVLLLWAFLLLLFLS